MGKLAQVWLQVVVEGILDCFRRFMMKASSLAPRQLAIQSLRNQRVKKVDAVGWRTLFVEYFEPRGLLYSDLGSSLVDAGYLSKQRYFEFAPEYGSDQ